MCRTKVCPPEPEEVEVLLIRKCGMNVLQGSPTFKVAKRRNLHVAEAARWQNLYQRLIAPPLKAWSSQRLRSARGYDLLYTRNCQAPGASRCQELPKDESYPRICLSPRSGQLARWRILQAAECSSGQEMSQTQIFQR
ncbi:hypothetical protein J6590_005972 [Homalodisca vitripennis]|nr:hypothetical protein J6590_005972 [Homalodisca vitripennis]